MPFDFMGAVNGTTLKFITKHDSAIDWEKTTVVEKSDDDENENERVVRNAEEFETKRDEVTISIKMGHEPSYIHYRMPTQREKLHAFSVAGLDPTKESELDLKYLVDFTEVAFVLGSLCVEDCPDHPELFPKEEKKKFPKVKQEAITPVVDSILTELGTYILRKMNDGNPS